MDLSNPGAGARRTLRAIVATVNTAVITGALVGGLGGRLFMRIIAATSTDRQGAITDADQVVGKVTTDGTIGLLIFGGVFGGIVVGLVFLVLRHWLPAKQWLSGLIASLIALGLFGSVSDLLNPESDDFQILSPLWLAVAMIVALAAFFGIAFGTIHARLERATPEIGLNLGALVYAPSLLLLPLGIPGVLMALAVLVGAFAPAAVNWWTQSDAVLRVGRIAVGGTFAATTALTVSRIGEILG